MSTNLIRQQPSVPSQAFPQVGERLCLDFVNTMEHRLSRAPQDLLVNDAALIAWARVFGVITEQQAEFLLLQTAGAARDALTRAIPFRETLFRVFANIAHRTPPDDADLQHIRDMYVEAIVHTHLFAMGNQYAFVEDTSGMTPDYILWVIARSALEVLTTDPLARLKECADLGDCGYLFLDTSKNGTRRWCSMDNCGSRAKMRRLYARKRGNRSVKHRD